MKKSLKLMKSYLQFLLSRMGIRKNWRREMGYEEYLELQKLKTNDSTRIERWKTLEWDFKLNGFVKMFKRHSDILKNCNNSLCLGARTGQEVAALMSLGLESIGIDLVEFPPYTIMGDIHELPFDNMSFDLAFTNIYDHILYPERFAEQCSRVLRDKGYLILHISLGFDPDKFSVSYVYNEREIIELFQEMGFFLVGSGIISNDYDSMNFELIFQRVY